MKLSNIVLQELVGISMSLGHKSTEVYIISIVVSCSICDFYMLSLLPLNKPLLLAIYHWISLFLEATVSWGQHIMKANIHKCSFSFFDVGGIIQSGPIDLSVCLLQTLAQVGSQRPSLSTWLHLHCLYIQRPECNCNLSTGKGGYGLLGNFNTFSLFYLLCIQH